MTETQDENARIGEEILAEVGGILFEHFAAAEWGRILVGVGRGKDGDPRIASIDVDEIVGDEKKVDDALGGEAIRAWLPALASAVDALLALDEGDLDVLEGGTFVRVGAGGMAFLSGLVRAPSPSFDGARDAALSWLRERNADLARRGISAASVDLDLDAGTARFPDSTGASRAPHRVGVVVLGSFSRSPRTWAWASANPSIPEPAGRACKAVLDAVPSRDVWEISTPQFATDEASSQALCAFVARSVDAAGVLKFGHPDGAIFVMVERSDPAV